MTDNPNTLSYWLNKDVTETLKPYYPHTNGFHKMGWKNCFLYLNVGLEVSPSFFVKNERLNLPAVELYDLKAGSKQGVRFGFVVRSPLNCRYTKDYLLFYRTAIDPKDIVTKGREAKRNYQIGNLLFFSIDDDAVLISNLEKSAFVESLEN